MGGAFRDDKPSRSLDVLRIVGTYVLFGVAWNLLSDLLLFAFIKDMAAFVRLETFISDCSYVAISAWILYVVINRRITRLLRTERELRDERDKAQRYLNVAGVMIVAIDSNERVSLINKKGCEVLGYKEQDILGRNWFDTFLPEAVRKDVHSVFLRLISGEIDSAEYYENPVLTKNGDERIIAWHNTVIKDESGKVICTLSSGQDVTDLKRAYEARRQRERTICGLLNAPTDTAILIDTEGTILAINQTAAERLCKSVDDLVGVNVYSLFPSAIANQRKARVDHVVQTGKPFRFEDVRDGIVFDNTLYPILDSNERVVQLVIYGRDITEQKRAYETLQRSEEHFRALIENALDAIGVVGLDGTILYESPSAERVLGYKPQDLVHTNVFELVHPEHRQRVSSAFSQVVQNPGAAFSGECPCRHKDGSWRVIEVTAKKLPSRDGVVVNYRDITERKRAEEILRDSEKRYRMLAETVTDVLWTLDIKTLRFTFVSPSVQLLRGYTVEEAMSLTLDQTLTPPSLKAAVQAIAEELALEDGPQNGSIRSRTLELEQTRKDGSTVWTEVTATFLRGSDGLPVEILGITRDITERRQKAEALRAIAFIDELTGLYNRRAFSTLCEQQLKVAHRTKRPMAVLFVDLDNMKLINDTFGHDEGDLALKEIGNILKESFRESDIIARIGGDEFAIMAVVVPKDSIEILTKRLREKIDVRNGAGNKSYHLSISLGVAHYDPEFPCSVEELLTLADASMYEEKNTKKILGQAEFLRTLIEKS